jgi:hypothetical protein
MSGHLKTNRKNSGKVINTAHTVRYCHESASRDAQELQRLETSCHSEGKNLVDGAALAEAYCADAGALTHYA